MKCAICKENIDEAVLRMHGLGGEEKEPVPEAKKCPRCGHINPHTMQNCIRCAGFLDQKAVFEQEEFEKKKREMDQVSNRLLKTLMKDPKIQGLVVDKLRETGQLSELINIAGT